MKWVVVGAGSAGCVVARRLVDAGHRVELMEAGPALRRGEVPSSIDGDDYFAAMREPGRAFDDLSARRTRGSAVTTYVRGRGEGGSSAINAMVALRGDRRLYESWGWSDTDDAFARVLVPTEQARTDEVGRFSRILLDVDHRAARARLTRHLGRRVTSAEAYLWPVQNELGAHPGTTVDRIEFDESGAAVGVRASDGSTVAADAVAVCAGSIHTPAIMLRSGVDGSGVGTGLQDHPSVALTLQMRDASGASGLATSALVDLDPVQLLPVDHLGQGADPSLAVLLVALMRPIGRSGTVRLVSDDPRIQPQVDLDLLSDDRDVERLISGVEEALQILRSTPIRRAVQEVFIDDVGTTSSVLEDRESLTEWVRARGADYVHASSSMAGALSSNGRVVGCEGLFVADASAFPSIPDVNTHLPTMMLAERFVQQWIVAESPATA